MGEPKAEPTNWMFPTSERGGSSMPDDGNHTSREDQGRIAREGEPPAHEPPTPPESTNKELCMSDLHRTVTEALDRIGIQYGQREDRDDLYFLGRDGVMLVVGARAVNEVPAAVTTEAFVLKNIECTKELAVDLLTRNSKLFAVHWAIHHQPDGTVEITLSHELWVEQLDAGLVERMVNRVLDNATAEIDALQATYGGERAFVVKEEQQPATIMPTGPLTYAGRFPGYESAQAMAAFLSVPGEGRPSYQVFCNHIWVFKGGGQVLFDGEGYEVVVGCCAEPDGTPVVVVTGFCEPNAENAEKVGMLILGERNALEQSAHSIGIFNEGDIGEIAASGELRQLRPSEVGAIPDSVEGEPASSVVFDRNLRFDGLYWAQMSSCRSYLRFYADGTVLQASTSGEPEQIARWFGKAHTDLPRGTYTFEGMSIEFSTASSDGTVDYEGQVNDEAIELSSHSRINGHKDRTTFSFVQVALQ